ncbi:MAG TPA: hypothetical protein VMG12_09750 [Polyangiaceae bacterium]|nr:hypothetical protein [Polyangiaceae bacterium]
MAKFSRAFPLRLVWPVALAAVSLAELVACGPSYDERSIKTADDRLKEQEELAYQEELRTRNKPAATGEVEESDKPGAFDDKQADLELRRATRSAETCPEVVTGDKVPHGKTTVTLTFALDGSVAEATIPPPYEGTRLGDCALNAYQAVIVPPYSGERKVISWDVNLEKPKEEKPASKKK